MSETLEELYAQIYARPTLRQRIRRLRGKFRSLWYQGRALFFPYNVVKIAALPRTWCDRDYVLFHANFQILVDFIELEQPYISWPDKKRGRITDLAKMRSFVQELYGPQGRAGFYADWYTEQEKADQDVRTDHALGINTQLLDLYEWYVTEQYEGSKNDPDSGYDEMDTKLIELIKLRRYLWT